MPLQRLPIFETLMRTRQVLWNIHNQEKRQIRELGDELEATLISAQRVLNSYEITDPLPDDKHEIDLRRQLGHTALPFPYMWIEWDLPADARDALRERDIGKARIAALCISARETQKQKSDDVQTIWDAPLPGLNVELSWQMTLFVANGHHPDVVAALPGVLCVALDDEGRFLGTFASLDDGVGGSRSIDDRTRALVRLGWGAIMAIGWLNCKNVTFDKRQTRYTVTERDANTNPAYRKGRKRKVTKFVDYHTIVLPHGAVETGGGSGVGGGARAGTRLHKVRGHFKTFTKERPLLGRATGTYWWGWQIRGNPKHGVAVTDYEVK